MKKYLPMLVLDKEMKASFYLLFLLAYSRIIAYRNKQGEKT